jgi:tRNA A37 threonylcarbamoyladenosine dehydratase
MPPAFSYPLAFVRNLGWVTPAEQGILRSKRIAIAGMGGVGGVHLLTLARLGIGAFHIADFDRFDLANFNRQVGATVTTLDLPKVDVLATLARDINPELQLALFRDGVHHGNMPAFSMAWICMSTGWISSPSVRVRPCSLPAPSAAYPPSRRRRWAWARRC